MFSLHLIPRHKVLAFLKTANAVVLAIAIAVALLDKLAPAQALPSQFRHWGTRDLVLVDKTASPAWHEALRHAASYWDKGRSGAEIRVRWVIGTGPCDLQPDQISVCGVTRQRLNAHTFLPLQGIANQDSEGGPHATAALVRVCSDCDVDASRREVIAVHEIGHALGLPHSPLRESVMFHGGGPEHPTPDDYALFRRMYAHVDKPGRSAAHCGVFGVKIGSICF